MRIVLLLIIKIYWILIPKSKRRRCLFKISCSNYVCNKTKFEGIISGMKALKFRVENCNPNYNIIEINNEKILISSRQFLFKEKEINQSILNRNYEKNITYCNCNCHN